MQIYCLQIVCFDQRLIALESSSALACQGHNNLSMATACPSGLGKQYVLLRMEKRKLRDDGVYVFGRALSPPVACVIVNTRPAAKETAI